MSSVPGGPSGRNESKRDCSPQLLHRFPSASLKKNFISTNYLLQCLLHYISCLSRTLSPPLFFRIYRPNILSIYLYLADNLCAIEEPMQFIKTHVSLRVCAFQIPQDFPNVSVSRSTFSFFSSPRILLFLLKRIRISYEPGKKKKDDSRGYLFIFLKKTWQQTTRKTKFPSKWTPLSPAPRIHHQLKNTPSEKPPLAYFPYANRLAVSSLYKHVSSSLKRLN